LQQEGLGSEFESGVKCELRFRVDDASEIKVRCWLQTVLDEGLECLCEEELNCGFARSVASVGGLESDFACKSRCPRAEVSVFLCEVKSQIEVASEFNCRFQSMQVLGSESLYDNPSNSGGASDCELLAPVDDVSECRSEDES
jgi:hypothetical protein